MPCIPRDTLCATSWHTSLERAQGRRHPSLHVSHKKTGPRGSPITQVTSYGCANLSFCSPLFHLCFHFDHSKEKNPRSRRVSRQPCHPSARCSYSPLALPHLCSFLSWPWTLLFSLRMWRQWFYLKQYYTLSKDSSLTFICPLNIPSDPASENFPFQRGSKFFYFVAVKTHSKYIFSLLLAASMFTKTQSLCKK